MYGNNFFSGRAQTGAVNQQSDGLLVAYKLHLEAQAAHVFMSNVRGTYSHPAAKQNNATERITIILVMLCRYRVCACMCVCMFDCLN